MGEVKREGMHYEGRQKVEKEYLSLSQLNEEIYNTVYDYNKLRKAFPKVCELMGVNPESFKQEGGKEYRIPKSSKTFWIMMLTSDGILKEKTKATDVYDFANKFKEIKDKLEKQLIEGNEDPYLNDNWTTFMESYYTTDAKKEIFSHALEQRTIEMILKCFKDIRKHVPDDRVVLYSEDYMERVKRSTNSVAKMIEEKYWEK